MIDPNTEAAEMLRELVVLATLDEGGAPSFRVRAYETALRAVEAHGGDLSVLSAAQLQRIEGVGKSTAERLRELFDTGRVKRLEELRLRFPPGVVALLRVPGIGPKGALRLAREAGVQSLDDLRGAVREQRIRKLRGFGPRVEEKLAEVLDRMARDGTDRRTPIAVALPLARRLEAAIQAAPGVSRVAHAGSLRRFVETVGTLDLLVVAKDADAAFDAVTAQPSVDRVLHRDGQSLRVATRRGMPIEVRRVAEEGFGAAMVWWTGSRAHRGALAARAAERGWVLGEAGLVEAATGTVVAAATEEAIYDRLGLPFIAPVLREGAGEIEAALRGELPACLPAASVVGDFHVHTDLSGDGQVALPDLVEAARARGYTVMAITEHAEGLTFNGVKREALLEQRARLRALEAELGGAIRLLHGIELNIGPRGELDYDLDFRRGFDFCLASVHDHFDLDRGTQTARILMAMNDPSVDMIGHLSARMIGARPGIDLDVEALIAGAEATGTAIEINGGLPRLDASSEFLRAARGRAVTFFLTSDAHRATELGRVDHARLHAQRGWVDPARIANAWDRERLLAWVAERRAPSG